MLSNCHFLGCILLILPVFGLFRCTRKHLEADQDPPFQQSRSAYLVRTKVLVATFTLTQINHTK